jgi:hypothetical protein
MSETRVKPLALEIGEWPGGTINGFECMFPEAEDGGIDLVLPCVCPVHARSVYWCLNAETLWCDGAPPEWKWHRMSVEVEDE